MKTWEMIKELTENPRKEFKREDGLVLSTSIDDTLIWDPGYTHLNLHDEWEEVKEPVDFMTAIESGHKVKVEHPFISEPYELEQFSKHYRYFTQLFEIFGTAWDESDVRKILLEGKWYVEQEV